MPVTVPIDLDVVGGDLADVIEDDLRSARAPAARAGRQVGDAFGDAITREVSQSTKEVDALLSEVTQTRTADIDVDVNGLQNLEQLRESLDLTRQRAEVKALEDALEDVAKLRRAGVDVEVQGQAQLAALDKALKAVERRRTVEVDVDTSGAIQAAQRGGGAMSEAFSGAFQLVAKNAIILGVVVAAAFAALPAVGAIAATGIVLAFGAGIAGIGILAAAQSKEVQKAFGSMADGIVKEMKRISAPLEDTLVAISGDIREAFDFFAPALEVAFAKMAPVLTRFSDQFFDAFETLAGAVVPITDAFDALLGAIGPKLDGFFSKLSASFINLADVVASDPELFASLFVGLLNVIPMVINVVATLAEAFKVIVDVVRANLKPAWDELVAAVSPLTSALSGTTSGMDIFRAAVMAVVFNLRLIINVITFTVRQTQLVARAFVSVGRSIASVWRSTRALTASVWASIRSSVSRAVAAVRGAVTSSMNAVRSTFSRVWSTTRAIVTGALATIRSSVTGAMSRVRSAVSSGLSAVRNAFSSGFSAARSVVSSAMSRIRSAVSSGISSVIGVVRGLPGRIRGALGSLGSTLFGSGVSLINGFASGIRAAIGNAVSAASSAVSRVRGLFPFSPAKEGPFSGRGYTTYSGEALMKDFAKSMEQASSAVLPRVVSALDPFAAAIPSVVPRSAGGGTTNNTTVNQGVDVSSLASLFSRLQVNVTLGRDRRTTAEWWLDGAALAGQLG